MGEIDGNTVIARALKQQVSTLLNKNYKIIAYYCCFVNRPVIVNTATSIDQ